MKPSLQLADRLYAAGQVGRRSTVSSLYSPGVYAVTALALLAASTLVLNNLAFLDENGLLVLTRPFFLPVFVCTVLLSLYLSLHATLHLVREREQGTLKVLFFGPVDGVSYLLGRLGSQTALFGLGAGLVLLWAVGLGWLTNLLVQVDLLAVLGLGLLTNGAVVAFGLLVAGWGRTARTALVLFLLAVLLVLAAQVGGQAIGQLASQSPTTRQDALGYLRAGLDGLNDLLLWLSPFAQMGRGMDALLVGDGGRLLLHSGAIVGQALVYFAGAVWALKRGGP
ncbi:MAG: ABC transporter permease subunit [Caldilineaceae bacterium]|nr:ABC transporter permease subunit [Caldilineaceae bacterium]